MRWTIFSKLSVWIGRFARHIFHRFYFSLKCSFWTRSWYQRSRLLSNFVTFSHFSNNTKWLIDQANAGGEPWMCGFSWGSVNCWTRQVSDGWNCAGVSIWDKLPLRIALIIIKRSLCISRLVIFMEKRGKPEKRVYKEKAEEFREGRPHEASNCEMEWSLEEVERWKGGVAWGGIVCVLTWSRARNARGTTQWMIFSRH